MVVQKFTTFDSRITVPRSDREGNSVILFPAPQFVNRCVIARRASNLRVKSLGVSRASNIYEENRRILLQSRIDYCIIQGPLRFLATGVPTETGNPIVRPRMETCPAPDGKKIGLVKL